MPWHQMQMNQCFRFDIQRFLLLWLIQLNVKRDEEKHKKWMNKNDDALNEWFIEHSKHRADEMHSLLQFLYYTCILTINPKCRIELTQCLCLECSANNQKQCLNLFVPHFVIFFFIFFSESVNEILCNV